MVEGGMKCVKYLLFIFNVIFVIAAISLITTGALVQTRFNDYFDFFGTKFNGAAILLIVVGVVMFVIAFFGCCGAIRENYVCTMVFAALLIVVFVLEMAGGIAGFVMRTSLRAEVSDIMMAAEVNYGKAGYNGVTETWDKVQEDFKCCGVNSPADWQNNARFLNSSVPDSCCRVLATRCGTIYPTFTGNIYPAGCLNATAGFLKENIYFVGAAGIGLAFVQIAGVIFACCLARSIKKEKGSS